MNKISLENRLISLLFLTTILILSIYSQHKAIAIVLRSRFIAIEQSVPSLPGEFALNEVQKKSIILINQQLDRDIKNILDSSQLQDLTAALSKGIDLRLALNNLSLSANQLKQLNQALRTAQIKIQQVLTPKQIEFIQEQQQYRQQKNSSHLTASLPQTISES